MTEKQTNALKVYLTDYYPDDEILTLVRDINYYDGSLESLFWENMDSFDELCEGMKAWEIARACFYGDFNPNHNYWRGDGYGNFESVDYVSFDESKIEEIIEAIDNIPYKYLPSEIQTVLDENEEDEEEEETEDEE